MANNCKLVEEKAALRRDFLGRRAGLATDKRSRAAEELVTAMPQLVAANRGGIIALYAASESLHELSLTPLAAALSQVGAPLALPRLTARGALMEFAAWDGHRSGLETAAFGLLQPSASAPAVTPSLVLTPGVAFARKDGTRLGMGGGYYDRALAAFCPLPCIIGVGFAIQMTDRLPSESHDVKCNALLSEEGLTWISMSSLSVPAPLAMSVL